MIVYYKETDRMCDIICEEYHLLQMMSRFGLPLGVGEKTVKQVCEENKVDAATFLAVANYIKNGPETAPYFVERVSVQSLIAYLLQAHTYFLDFQLPSIRRNLLEAIDCSDRNEVAFLILKFFDEYMGEVRKHMTYENRRIFPYVEQLLKGVRPHNYNISMYGRSHDAVDRKLQELKNIIIKYYKGPDDVQRLSNVLVDIFNCEADLHTHNEVEDLLFIPAVRLLEEKISVKTTEAQTSTTTKEDLLSEREREIVASIVRGMTNKEVAEHLFISLNTVLTHRKNIARKLSIHSVSGLTIYAIVNGIVKIEDIPIS